MDLSLVAKYCSAIVAVLGTTVILEHFNLDVAKQMVSQESSKLVNEVGNLQLEPSNIPVQAASMEEIESVPGEFTRHNWLFSWSDLDSVVNNILEMISDFYFYAHNLPDWFFLVMGVLMANIFLSKIIKGEV